jgi:hypothetical protein
MKFFKNDDDNQTLNNENRGKQKYQLITAPAQKADSVVTEALCL